MMMDSREGYSLSLKEVEAILDSKMEKKELLELVHSMPYHLF